MNGDEQFAPLFDAAEVLSDPALEINIDCIRPGVKWVMENGDVQALTVFATTYGML